MIYLSTHCSSLPQTTTQLQKKKGRLLSLFLRTDRPVAHSHAPSASVGGSRLVGVEVLDHLASLGDDVESARGVDCELAHSESPFGG